MKNNNHIKQILPIALKSILCGIFTGAVIFFFKLCARAAESLSDAMYDAAKGGVIPAVILFAVLLAFALATVLLHKYVPEVRGGGIPRSEGILRGVLRFRPVATLAGTIVGSFISFFCGLPLGSEGPAVLIGTSVGGLFSGKDGRKNAHSRYVMTGGAGAGFAVATGAPLSAMLFALEEIHKRFTPILVISVSTAVLGATYVNNLLCSAFGLSPALFDFSDLSAFSLENTGYLLLLGILMAAAVGVFDASIEHFGKISAKITKRLPGSGKSVKIVLLFVTTGILGLVFSDALYSGHHTIETLISENKGVLFISLLLIVRLVMMLFVTDSSATGGIFIPTLAVGALAAALCAKLLTFLGMPHEIYDSAVLLGMCAFLGGTLRAPLTAAVLYVELTGQLSNMFYVALVVFAVNFITESFHRTAFYDRVLESLEKAQNSGKEPKTAYFEMKVMPDAFAAGKAVRDVMWPHASVVVSISRERDGFCDTDSDGEKILRVGDTLVLRARFYDDEEIKQQLRALVGESASILERTSASAV